MVRTNGAVLPDSVLAWVYLIRVFHLIHARSSRDFRAGGLTPPQFDVLAQLGASPQGMTQRALGERLLCTKANVSVVLQGMIRQDLISRREHVHDRRFNLVRLTEKGRRRRAAVLPAHEGRIHAWMAQALSRAEQRQLRQLLYKVVRTLYRGPAKGGTRNGRGIAEETGGRSS